MSQGISWRPPPQPWVWVRRVDSPKRLFPGSLKSEGLPLPQLDQLEVLPVEKAKHRVLYAPRVTAWTLPAWPRDPEC